MEKEYFYLSGESKIGPLSLDALKSAPIARTTLVWYSSIPDWVEAGTLPELAEVFVSIAPPPPPVPSYSANTVSGNSTGGSFNNNPEKPPMPENYLVWSILATVFCCWPLGIFAIINAAKVSSAYNAGDYQGALNASASAKKWTIATACVGGISVIIVSVIYAIAGVAYFSTLGL